ncbi:MAG TPA: TetR/AcrR family transcriptional regulator [Bacillota bacterium]|nr:TetR/AcrR family transcriptional regulator [Bacillota bacterium]
MSTQSDHLNQKIMTGLENMIPDKGTRQILFNALDVFAKKGLAGTKIKDIAQKAGFSQGFVYNYFKSKDEIFVKIADLAAEGAAAMVKNASELEGTPYQKIYWLVEALLDPDSVTLHHWRLIMLQASTSEAVPEEAKRISADKMKIPIQYLIPVIEAGQAAGEIVAENPLALAIAFFSIIQGLGITRMQGGKEMPFPSVDLILRFLKP